MSTKKSERTVLSNLVRSAISDYRDAAEDTRYLASMLEEHYPRVNWDTHIALHCGEDDAFIDWCEYLPWHHARAVQVQMSAFLRVRRLLAIRNAFA